MNYQVSEIFYSIQGEGSLVGTPAVFVRLFGCNLSCPWCDTLYASDQNNPNNVFEMLDAEEIFRKVMKVGGKCRRVVITGGEPFMQDIPELIRTLYKNRFSVQVETNGTLWRPAGVPVWITCSPKPGIPLNPVMLTELNECKIVVGSAADANHVCEVVSRLKSNTPIYIQPNSTIDGALEYCIKLVKENPTWKLSIQTHRLISIR